MYTIKYWYEWDIALYEEGFPRDELLTLYEPNSEHDIKSATLKMTYGGAGELKVVVPPTNEDVYNNINLLSSEVIVYRDDEELWRGRPITWEQDTEGNLTLTCEGILCILNDVYVPPMSFTGTPREFLEDLAAIFNNAQAGLHVSYQRQILVNSIPESYETGVTITRSWSEYTSIWNILANHLTSTSLGGYVSLRRAKTSEGVESQVYLLDYTVLDSEREGDAQTITYGSNILDIAKTWEYTDVITRVIPLGAKDDDGNYITIKSVNDGKDYWYNPDHPDQNTGAIYEVAIFSDITTPAALLKKGKEYLEQNYVGIASFTVKALDLAYISDDYQYFNVGDKIYIESEEHQVGTWRNLEEVTYDLTNPANDEYTFGLLWESNSLTASTASAESSTTETVSKMTSAVKVLEANAITTSTLTAAVANISTLNATDAIITNIKATAVDSDTVTARIVNASEANIDQIKAKTVTSDAIKTGIVNATTAQIDEISAKTVTSGAIKTGIINASSADIDEISAKTVTSAAVTTGILNATTAEIGKISAKTVTTDTVVAGLVDGEKGDFDDLTANTAFITDLTSKTVTADNINATGITSNDAFLTNVYANVVDANKAEITDLVTTNLKVDSINGKFITNASVLAKALSNDMVETVCGVKVYYQAEEPTGGEYSAGDIWYQTLVDKEQNPYESALYEYSTTDGWVKKDYDAGENGILRENVITAQEIAANTITGTEITAQNISDDQAHSWINFHTGEFSYGDGTKEQISFKDGDLYIDADKVQLTTGSLTAKLNSMQMQIDGTVTVYSGTDKPTVANEPACNWTTITDQAYNASIGTKYYDGSGIAYRYKLLGYLGLESGEILTDGSGIFPYYGWEKIGDTEVSGAYAKAIDAINRANAAAQTAATAESTADGAASSVSAAQSTANAANVTANTAQSTANKASTGIATAQSTANTANSTANAANATASTANSLASSAAETANSASASTNSLVTVTEKITATVKDEADELNLTKTAVFGTTEIPEEYKTSCAIKQLTDEISLKVDSEDYTGNKLIAMINLTPGQIDMEGTVTANGTFKIDTAGNMTATGGNIAGWVIGDTSIFKNDASTARVSLSSNIDDLHLEVATLDETSQGGYYDKIVTRLDTDGITYKNYSSYNVLSNAVYIGNYTGAYGGIYVTDGTNSSQVLSTGIHAVEFYEDGTSLANKYQPLMTKKTITISVSFGSAVYVGGAKDVGNATAVCGWHFSGTGEGSCFLYKCYISGGALHWNARKMTTDSVSVTLYVDVM